MYVLAQFRSNLNFEWVRELRGTLARNELKHKDLVDNQVCLRRDRALWKRVSNGLGQATIIVIDLTPIHDVVVFRTV